MPFPHVCALLCSFFQNVLMFWIFFTARDWFALAANVHGKLISCNFGHRFGKTHSGIFCNTTIALLFSSWLLATSTAQFFHRLGQSLWLERCGNPQVPEKESLHGVCLLDRQQFPFSTPCLLVCVGTGSAAAWCAGSAAQFPLPIWKAVCVCLHSRHPGFPRSKAGLTQGEHGYVHGKLNPVPQQTTMLPPGPCRRQNPTVRGHRTDNSDFIQNWHSSCALPMHRAVRPSGVIFQRLVH